MPVVWSVQTTFVGPSLSDLSIKLSPQEEVPEEWEAGEGVPEEWGAGKSDEILQENCESEFDDAYKIGHQESTDGYETSPFASSHSCDHETSANSDGDACRGTAVSSRGVVTNPIDHKTSTDSPGPVAPGQSPGGKTNILPASAYEKGEVVQYWSETFQHWRDTTVESFSTRDSRLNLECKKYAMTAKIRKKKPLPDRTTAVVAASGLVLGAGGDVEADAGGAKISEEAATPPLSESDSDVEVRAGVGAGNPTRNPARANPTRAAVVLVGSGGSEAVLDVLQPCSTESRVVLGVFARRTGKHIQ